MGMKKEKQTVWQICTTDDDSFDFEFDGVILQGRQLPSIEHDSLLSKYVKDQNDSDQMYEFLVAQFVRTFVGWPEGLFVDKNKNPLPCNEETKRIIYRRNPALARSIQQAINGHRVTKVQVEYENLSSGADGSQEA